MIFPDTRQVSIPFETVDGNVSYEVVTFENRGGKAIFEGDIFLGDTEKLLNGGQETYGTFGVVTTAVGAKWTNGRVPYSFSSEISAEERINIISVMSELKSYANVDFYQRTYEVDYIKIMRTNDPNIGGSSYVGKQGGMQEFTLQQSYSNGTIRHELLHALGFWHEQSRPDRDSYVVIDWQNIASGYEHNFEKRTSNVYYSATYDFNSIMHYPTWALSKNGLPTITPVGQNSVGPGDFMTEEDKETLRSRYGAALVEPYVTFVQVEWQRCNQVSYIASVMWDGVSSGLTYELEKMEANWYQVYSGTNNFKQGISTLPGTDLNLRVRAVSSLQTGSWHYFSIAAPLCN